MKQKIIFSVCLLVLFLQLPVKLTSINLIPVRTEVAGFPDWEDINVGGTTYLQLFESGAATISPSMNFSDYTSIQLEFRARTMGGSNVNENTITISVSVDNGLNWETAGTYTPLTSSLKAVTPLSLNSFTGTQVKIKLSVAGEISTMGAAIDDISITGQSLNQFTLSLSNDGEAYTDEGYPLIVDAGSSIVLPALPDCGEWQFAGWDENPTLISDPTYLKGTSVLMPSTDLHLFAIYKKYDSSGEIWSEVQAIDDITSGVYVITNGDYFLPAAIVTNGPALVTLTQASVGVVSGKLSGIVQDNMRWELTGSATLFTLQYAGNYLYNKDLSDGVNVGTISTTWTLEEYSNGFAMVDNTFNRYCAVNPGASEWRSYTTRNYSSYSINKGVLELYKLTGSSSISFTSEPGCRIIIAEEPTGHVSNFSVSPASVTYNSLSLTWSDVPGTTAYLIKGSKSSNNAPVDGAPDVNAVLVKNVEAGVQFVSFTELESSVEYNFAIYPYNGTSRSINYKTDGEVPVVSVRTAESPWLENFESGSKLSYAVSDVVLSTGIWNLSDALLGTDVNDKKNGQKGVRLRTNGALTMNFDKGNGMGNVTISHANYGLLSGGSWKLQISGNAGSDWEDVGGEVTCSSILSSVQFTINRTGYNRLRISQTAGDRINIDDIHISDYNLNPAVTTWTGILSNDWLANGNWDNGLPGENSEVIIGTSINYPEIRSLVTVASLEVMPLAGISIMQGGDLTVSGNLTLKSSASGTATLLNEGGLTVNGQSRTEQYLEASEVGGSWWYISSPVVNALSATFLLAASGNKFGYYDETTGDYPQINTENIVLETGKGYLAWIASSGNYYFDGQLQNGIINPVSLSRTPAAGSKRGFNLVGNPYPSFIDWNSITGFGTGRMRTDIRPTIWIRTRNAVGDMVFDTFDGEDGTSLGIRGQIGRYIAPAQAFWVKVTVDDTHPVLQFTNSIRSHQDQSMGNNLLKNKPKRSLIKLELHQGSYRDEMIIGENDMASDGFDIYDSEKMITGHSELFSLVGNKELVINKMNKLEAGKSVNLGFRPVKSSNYTIKATVLPESIKVILRDLLLSVDRELNKDSIYTFTSDITESPDRFVLQFKSPDLLTKANSLSKVKLHVKQSINRRITVSGEDIKSGNTINIYNTEGKRVFSQLAEGINTLINCQLESGIYIIEIEGDSVKFQLN